MELDTDSCPPQGRAQFPARAGTAPECQAPVYMPMNPKRVNMLLPAETTLEKPFSVRISPYTSQGWRPSSAVIHPAVLAIYGKGAESKRIHKHPALKESAAPQQQQSNRHDRDEERPQANHDVVTVIKQRDVIRPILFRESVESADVGIPAPVSQHAQHSRNCNRVIDLALLVR
jgi:hypothetical protein